MNGFSVLDKVLRFVCNQWSEIRNILLLIIKKNAANIFFASDIITFKVLLVFYGVAIPVSSLLISFFCIYDLSYVIIQVI